MSVRRTSAVSRLAAGCRIVLGVALISGSQQIAQADTASADSENPPVPLLPVDSSGTDQPSQIRVALLDSGVNYQLPAIAERLARDSAGRLIGYDFWDMDPWPFDAHPNGRGGILRHGTRTASLLLREAPFVELVPYRYPRPDMSRMTALVEHAAKHDVRIVGMPLGGNLKEEWSAFEAVAQAHPDMLFIASAGNNGRDIDRVPVYPAALRLENMLVVTSADDFVRLAEGVNWGRVSVDYLLPAERQWVTKFDGSSAQVSGSSYAVPRMVALAARYLRDDRSLTASDLIAKIRTRFANGFLPKQIAQGYINDPQFDELSTIEVVSTHRWQQPLILTEQAIANESVYSGLRLPLDVLVLDTAWSSIEVIDLLSGAQSILGQCGFTFDEVTIRTIRSPDYLHDLETGAAKTLMDAVGFQGPDRRLTVVLARDTKMNLPFDAEAFGRANTRSRPWLTGSVWLTLALQDRPIALAHELFHVLVNSGEHSIEEDNLMLARTTGANSRLSDSQCELARLASLGGGWSY